MAWPVLGRKGQLQRDNQSEWDYCPDRGARANSYVSRCRALPRVRDHRPRFPLQSTDWDQPDGEVRNFLIRSLTYVHSGVPGGCERARRRWPRTGSYAGRGAIGLQF
jgi:hypothetical protein